MTYGKNWDFKKKRVTEIGKLSWKEFCLEVEYLKSRNQHEIAKKYLLARFATDIEHFADYYFPHYCTLPFNQLHRDRFTRAEFGERAIRLATAAPRGYAKSTIEALIKPIHDVCYGLENFIVILSNTEAQATQKLRDIRAEVLTNIELVNDYGIGFRTKKPGETEYTIYCADHSCLFQGYGAGAEIRGIRNNQYRPTKIVCDDIEHSEEVLNEAIRKKYEDWFREVVSKIGTKTTNIIVVGTILHPESLLKGLTQNAAYDSEVYRAVIEWPKNMRLWDEWKKIYTNLDDDEHKQKAQAFYEQNKTALLDGHNVLWPEKESMLDLMKERIETGDRAFEKEKQNSPTLGDESVFETLYYYEEVSEGFRIEHNGIIVPWSDLKDKEGRWLNAYGALDPSTGEVKPTGGKTLDFSCLLTGIKDRRERLFVHRDWTKRASPTKYIAEIFEHHLEFGYLKFAVETNLYRNLLLPNIFAEKRRLELIHRKEINLSFYDVENTENKRKRIYTLEPKVAHKHILFNKALSRECIGQIIGFPWANHDDAPDCLEMLFNLVHNRYKASALNKDAMGGR